MTERLVAHPLTGEALDADFVGREWARLTRQIHEAQEELAVLVAARDELDPAMRAACEEYGRVDGGGVWIVLAPPARRPAQRVNTQAAENHAEELMALGLGRMAYRSPTAQELREKAASVIAAGLPLQQLLPDAPPARLELTTAPKGH